MYTCLIVNLSDTVVELQLIRFWTIEEPPLEFTFLIFIAIYNWSKAIFKQLRTGNPDKNELSLYFHESILFDYDLQSGD